jgi:hypothetical protein
MNAGNCVEVATALGAVAVRDTRDRAGQVIDYPADSWRSFVSQARSGFFDFSR